MFAVMRRDGIPIPVDPKTKKFSCATKLTKGMIATYPLLATPSSLTQRAVVHTKPTKQCSACSC
jgi:hypothetical protein